MNTRRCCPQDPDAKADWEADLSSQLTSLPDEERIETLSEILHALSHPIRLKIAFLLLTQDQCVCELVKLTGKAPNLVSHHLMVMRKSGIVSAYMNSGEKYYKLKEIIMPLLKKFKDIC